MSLTPVKKTLVSDGIVEQIRKLILSGEFPPGHKLTPEVEMARTLSVSRSSLREALNALVYLGYLQRRNKGMVVAPKTAWPAGLSSSLGPSREEQSVAEMIEVRRIVEPALCALAARRAGPEDLRDLEESLRRMENCLKDPVSFVDSDHHFHLFVARAAQNGILEDFLERVRDLLHSNIAVLIRKSPISSRSLNFHRKILQAIRSGDPSRARRIMAAHIADIQKEFLKILLRPPGRRGRGAGRLALKKEEV